MHWVTVSDTNGCIGVSDTVTVTMHPATATPTIHRSADSLHASDASSWQWYRNGNPLAGQTRQALALPDVGSYTVENTDSNGCRAMSDPFEVVVLAVQGLPAAVRGFDVYPNPSDGRLTLVLSLRVPSSVDVTVSDVLGREIHAVSFSDVREVHETLDPGNVIPGHYLLRVRLADGGVMTRMLRVK